MSNTGGAESLNELRALSKIIQDSLDAIDAAITAKNLEFPSLDTPFTPESEAARSLPEVAKASDFIVAAAMHLVMSVRQPMLSAVNSAVQHTVSGALRVAIEANVPEILRDVGPEGAHIRDITKISGADPTKLGRILRALATHHIFREIKPDVFAHNRVSSVLDTGSSVKEIQANRLSKYVGNSGIASTVAHGGDDLLKASAYLSEALLDPKTAFSEEPTESALIIGLKLDGTLWDWFEKDEARRIRFSHAMQGARQASAPNAILDGFDWKGLKQDALVVDVGGGIGSQSMILAQNFSHLKFVVQDREETLKDAAVFFDGQLPGSLTSGRVVLQSHDFLTPQPIKNADVFLVKTILHDWSDKYCLQILSHLRAAATPSTHLIVVETIISHVCADDTLAAVPGAAVQRPPAPLLPNGGYASAMPHYMDIAMLELFNAFERTVAEFQKLFEKTGWKLVQVVPSASFAASKVIAVPA